MISNESAKWGRALTSSAIVAAWLLLFAKPLLGAAAETKIDSVQIGFAEHYKVGHWVPIRVQITSTHALKGRVELIVPDGEGSPYSTVYENQQIENGKTTLNLLAKFGRVDSYLSVRISSELPDQNSVERVFAANEIKNALPTRERLIVSIGTDIGIEQAIRQRLRTSVDEYHVAIVDSATSLPHDWIGYTGVDLLVLTTQKSEAVHQLTTQQGAAINEYVRRGGRVVFSAGERAAEVFSDSNPLAGLLPGRFVETIKETQTGGLEEYVGGAIQRLDRSASPEIEFQYAIARISDVQGQVLASEGIRDNRTPLILAGFSGIGQSIYTAFDLDDPMIAAWQDRTKLLNRIIEIAFPRTIDSEDDRGTVSMTRSGFDDLTGQLRVSLESFPGVRLTFFSIVAGFCLLYLALIGPVDYFILRRFGNAFSWTWVTFPVVVLGFCAAAFYFSAWSKSTDDHLTALHIIDVDERQVDGNSWLSLFSPQSSIHDYSLLPKASGSDKVVASRLGWQGLPGSGFGGMNGGVMSQSTVPQYEIISQIADDGCRVMKMSQLPIATNSSRNFFGTWQVELQEENNVATSNLIADREKQLSGTIANPMSCRLANCMLVYDRWTYNLNNFEPGESKSLLGMIARDIKTPITRQKIRNGRTEMTVWDREATDRARIGQMMMFFNTVRGESYTRLYHRFQNHVDGSAAMKSGRAFLIGQAEDSPVDLMRDHEAFLGSGDDHVTIYRISIPVQER